MSTAIQAVKGETESKGLKPGALGLVSSVVVGVASTAPAYSLAAALGFIVVSRCRQPGRRRARAGRHPAGVRPDVPHRRRVPGAQQGGAGLRHDVHLGVAHLRTGRGLARWLGHHRRRRHRHGEPGPDRGPDDVRVHRQHRLAGRRHRGRELLGQHRRQHLVGAGRRPDLDRAHDLDLLPRHRDLGAPAADPAVHRGRRPDHLRACSR